MPDTLGSQSIAPIGIISLDPADQEALRQKLTSSGARVEIFTTATALRTASGNKKFRGFVTDMRTTLKASPADKTFMQELQSYFPFMKVNLSAGQLACLVDGKPREGQAAFDDFVTHLCRPDQAKGVRIHPRRSTYQSIFWRSPSRELPPEWTRGFTVNISAGGLFVASSNFQPLMNELVEINSNNDTEMTPIVCAVKWTVPWGSTTKVPPGMGLAFPELNETQRRWLGQIAGV